MKKNEDNDSLFRRMLITTKNVFLTEYGLLIAFIAILVTILITWLTWNIADVFETIKQVFEDID